MNVDSRQCIICKGTKGELTSYTFFPAGRRRFKAYAHRECFEKFRGGEVANPISEYKIQIDRWPTSAGRNAPNVVSIIVLNMYLGRPDTHQLARLLEAIASDLLKEEAK